MNDRESEEGVELRPKNEFERELSALLNRHSMEKMSDTPDYILAEYLVDCLEAYHKVAKARKNYFRPQTRIALDPSEDD